MGRPSQDPYTQTIRTGSRVIAWALSLALLGACHGRPLLTQMAPGGRRARTGDASGTAARATEDERRVPRLDLLEGDNRLSSAGNVLRAEDFRRIAQDMARRDPRISEPSSPKGLVRAAMDEDLAHPACPSFEDPAKALVPGGICLDPLTLFVCVTRLAAALRNGGLGR